MCYVRAHTHAGEKFVWYGIKVELCTRFREDSHGGGAEVLKDVKHLARRPEDAVSLQNRAQASGLSRVAERDHLT